MTATEAVLYECYHCHLAKSLDAFSKSAPRRRTFLCRVCARAIWQEKYGENRAKADAIKVARGCADCGYNAHPAALDFDHLPSFEKKMDVSKMYAKPWHEITEEMAKCEVVCANCHRIRTMERHATGAFFDAKRAAAAEAVIVEERVLRLFEDTA